MRIVIDLQGAQTESRFRGIGRYALSLSKAIARNAGEHEVLLALNGLLSDAIEPIRSAFDGLIPQDNIRVWHAPGPVREYESENGPRRRVAERIREAFIASLNPDVVHISSLFEGYVDDAVTSIGVFATQLPSVVTLYDLVPYKNPEAYLAPNPSYEQAYLRKIGHLKRANAWLSISEFSAREGVETLHLPSQSVVSISSASEEMFQPLRFTGNEAAELCNRFGIARPFVMYAGAADPRKNLDRLLRAYGSLDSNIRRDHQLVLAGTISQEERSALQKAARSIGLRHDELLFAGHVSDNELVQLYNLCRLFVLPSLHEGFGLPALEAMSCGAPVIGSNTSSVPEVIGRDDALFDPNSQQAIAAKMAEALTDHVFRTALARHGLERAKTFSWNASARRAIDVFETFRPGAQATPVKRRYAADRPKLAFVSPLPPERTGIADYSAQLLPELAAHYDIDVVVSQERIADPWIQANCAVRTRDWLRSNHRKRHRVPYHFGNSMFHSDMFSLLRDVPGAVVLHDFFLGDVLAALELSNVAPHIWSSELYRSHGYGALAMRLQAKDLNGVNRKYPSNLSVLQQATGIIVHSNYARELARIWYGETVAARWTVIPLLRAPRTNVKGADARRRLGLTEEDLVVCSFGVVASSKLNHRLLDAWFASSLSTNQRCILIFAGDTIGGDDYSTNLERTARMKQAGDRVRITGWLKAQELSDYLAAADIAVQLRAESRGETSAAVLDCMNAGLPTIVNANGSFAELPPDAVWMIADEFEDRELIRALEALSRDKMRREKLGERAREVIRSRHSPCACAERYVEAIESSYREGRIGTQALIDAIAEVDDYRPTERETLALAQSIAQTFEARPRIRQILVDVSVMRRADLRTGIERVVRSLILALIGSLPPGFRLEPVYLAEAGGRWHYRYAREFTLQLLGYTSDALTESTVDFHAGDILLGTHLDDTILADADAQGLFARMSHAGVLNYSIVYDLLPILLPHAFPPGGDARHTRWLRTITSPRFHGALCISRTVADDLFDWLNAHGPSRLRSFGIGWFELGADTEVSAPTRGLPASAGAVLRGLAERPSFLMVGTVEPRKGHAQALEAFEQLWRAGIDVNLVIVGSEGWRALPDDMRRSIPKTAALLRNHPERLCRLFWLEDISDEYLEQVYRASTCLIAASENEGFGLPLIEAAENKLPIIARDLPVFREAASDHAFYFTGSDPGRLATAIRDWLSLNRQEAAPTSEKITGKRWVESARQVCDLILRQQWKRFWPGISSCESSCVDPSSRRPLGGKATDQVERVVRPAIAG